MQDNQTVTLCDRNLTVSWPMIGQSHSNVLNSTWGQQTTREPDRVTLHETQAQKTT